jgi:mRNA interferase RelE/StbE
MMSFRLVYTRSSIKDIRKLDQIAKKRLKAKIEKFSKSPIKNARKLSDPAHGTFRWRIGSYRVVFDIIEKDIVILRIRHRKEVYKL